MLQSRQLNGYVLTDLQLCFATLFILFKSESTEGIEAGQTTALDYENTQETDNHEDNQKSEDEIK